jgi:hypothetical protein
LSGSLPGPIQYESHREFVRQTLRNEVQLSARGTEIVDRSQESEATRAYREQMNSEGSPSETAAAGYVWHPGTELATTAKGQSSNVPYEIRSNV